MKKPTLVSIGIIIATAFIFLSYSNQINKEKEVVLLGHINEILKNYHFKPAELNDEFSEKAYTLYLKRLDYSKNHLTKDDLTILETFKFKLDDELQNHSFEFFDISLELIEQRINESEKMCMEILDSTFDFSIQEDFEIDSDKREFPKDETEKREIWRKSLKAQAIDKLYSLHKKQMKDLEEYPDSIKELPFDSLVAKAQNYIKDRYVSRFKRIHQINRQDRLSTYINSLTNVFDPHTGYFPPKDKENFDIAISGKLEGIGATLQEKDGYIKVTRIVPGSASWRQGELEAGDIILKVGQADEEPVDIVDMRLDDAVQLIRGKKGTVVKLTVKKIDGSVTIIPIVRDVVELEETYAKSTVISDEKGKKKIGYIYLPKFYVDFNNSRGRRCADDILKEINFLKKKSIDGLILDLRDNGGGSLSDVVKIGGFFIEKGPIVQVKSKFVEPKILSDTDSKIQYDGPLIIMVNSFSASASEILAAAMQDYNRALIVGTESSYGKGTVQRFLDIDRLIMPEYAHLKPFGEMKITIQKFFRINGGSTQLKGVSSDIVLPDSYSKLDIGEKEHEYPMAWGEIPATSYAKLPNNFDIEKLKKKSAERVEKNESMQLVNEFSASLKNNKEKTVYQLEYSAFKANEESEEEQSKKFDEIDKTITGLKILIPLEENPKNKLDSLNVQRKKEWHKELKKDIQLYETVNIMNDIIK